MSVSLPARCPDCGGDELRKFLCGRCEGTGQITVLLPDGKLWSKDCKRTGRNIGGGIQLPGRPPPPEGFPTGNTGCVWCGGATDCVVWTCIDEDFKPGEDLAKP